MDLGYRGYTCACVILTIYLKHFEKRLIAAMAVSIHISRSLNAGNAQKQQKKKVKSAQHLHLLLFLLLVTTRFAPLLEIPPATNAFFPRILPLLLIVALPLARLKLFFFLALLTTFLLQARLELSPASRFFFQ